MQEKTKGRGSLLVYLCLEDMLYCYPALAGGGFRRIDDAREKERLKGLAKQSVPPGFGIIIRTAAAGSTGNFKGEIDGF